MRPSVLQLKHTDGRTYRHDLLSVRLVYAGRADKEKEIYQRGTGTMYGSTLYIDRVYCRISRLFSSNVDSLSR